MMTNMQPITQTINTKITHKTRSDSTNITSKLAKLEEQKQTLIKQRQEQIFDIISGTSALAVEDELIAGALLFLVNKDNARNPIIQEFRDLTRKHKIKLPSRRR